MTAALEFFGDFQCFAVAAAQADDDGAVGLAEKSDEDGVRRGVAFQELVDDDVVVADDSVHVADGGSDFGDVALAPFQADGILNPAFDSHHFEQRMIQKALELAVDNGMEIPKAVGLDEAGVIIGDKKIGMSVEKEVADVGELGEALQLGGTDAIFLTQFVAKQAGGFGDVVDQLGLFGLNFGGVMIDRQPAGFVQARLEREVGDPADSLPQIAVFPTLVMIGLEADDGSEETLGQALEKQSTHETVEVAFVRQYDFWLGEVHLMD
jgi:hypothetical protein